MKIRILLTALIISFAALPSRADITPVEASSPDYLRNHGHSGSIIEMVQMTKAGANGEEYITVDNAKHANDSKFVRWVRNFFIYIDPALDDGSFMRHDSKSVPHFDDL